MSLTNVRTFKSLTAGSTAIMPDGKVLRFGGLIEKQDHGTKVGHGTITTSDPAAIAHLEELCKQPTPQVWEVKDMAEETVAPAVANTVVQNNVAAQENVEAAVRSTNPAVAALQAKMGTVIAETNKPQ